MAKLRNNYQKLFITLSFQVWACVLLVSLVLLARPGHAAPFYFGVNADNWQGEIQSPGFAQALQAMGTQFVVWHISPEELATDRIMECVAFCRKYNLGYLFNTELTNYVPGIPEFTNSDGTYRWDLSKQVLERFQDDPLFWGQVYDEPMLMQSLNGEVVHGRQIPPYFADTADLSPEQAFDLVTQKITQITALHASYGHRAVFEMVFPDYAHAPARGGAILAPKLLKETPNDLMFSVYAGAARQYQHEELWACIDLWFLDKFPDKGQGGLRTHSPENFYTSLCYAYEQGFDYVYVEHLKALVDFNTGQLTDYGQQVVAFQQQKKDLSRGSWQKFEPQVVVKRFPGGYWGQKYSSFLPDHPYGAQKSKKIHQQDEQWLALLSQISHNKLPAEANNWNAALHPYFQKESYFPLAGLPPMLVVDHYFTQQTDFPQAQFMDLTQN